MHKHKFLFIFFTIFLFFNLLNSCYYNNYYSYKKIDCVSNRDYPTYEIGENYSLEKSNPEGIGFNKLILAKENGKNVLIGAIYNVNDPQKHQAIFYKYNKNSKRFVYLGTFSNGFIGDVNSNNNYEIIFQNFLTNELVIKEEEINSFDLRENETLFWVKDSYIITKLENETTVNITFYKYGSSLIKYYEFSFEKDSFQDLFIYNDEIYILLDGVWYLVNSQNIGNWEEKTGYKRENRFNTYVINQYLAKFISFTSLPMTIEINFYKEEDPLFTITNFKGNETIFILDKYEKELYLYDRDKNLIKTFYNISFFAVNRDKIFLVKDNEIYYTEDLYNEYLIFNSTTEIKSIYLFDFDNDGKSELVILTNNGEVFLFNEVEQPKVDYFVKEIKFPTYYTTYSDHFNISVCSRGNQIIPLDIIVSIKNNATNLEIKQEFTSQIIDVYSCKKYKINYIPFKRGVLNVSVVLKVNDSNKENNIYSINKEILNDYWFVKFENGEFVINNYSTQGEGFLMIDENNDLSDGYEKINISVENCSFVLVDYNNDNITEYLINCNIPDIPFKLLDPLNKKVFDVKEVKEEDFHFFAGLVNITHFLVILPWNGYKGYIEEVNSDNVSALVLIDYDLDGKEDFKTYPYALGSDGKSLYEFNYLTGNLKILNYSVNIDFGEDFLITVVLNLGYKGLFNRKGTVKINILGEEKELNITDENLIKKIPLSSYPLPDFSSITLNYQFDKKEYNDFKIKIDYPLQYNKTDDEILIKNCDLKIENVDLDNNLLLLNKSGDCIGKIKLIVMDKNNLILFNDYIDNQTNIISLNLVPSPFYRFIVFYENVIDRNYKNNKLEINYDLQKLINFEQITEKIKVYQLNNLEFSLRCDKNLNLNIDLNCGILNKNESFICDENGKKFSYEITPFEKFNCNLKIYNNDLNIDISKKLVFDFEFPKALETFNLENKKITILEINGEKKALFNENLIEVNEIKIKKENFKSSLNGEQGKLNIFYIEIPEYLEVVDVEGENLIYSKRGNEIIIKTLGNKVEIKTKTLKELNESEKEKYGVVGEEESVKKNKSFSKIIKIIIYILLFSAIITIFSLVGYYSYKYYLKNKKMEEKKKEIGHYYEIHRKKEEELIKKQKEEIERRKQKIIEEEAKRLINWVKFLLETYDEEEIYNYLIRKGYKKEVVDKAFELFKKRK